MADARNPSAPVAPLEVLGDADNLMSRHRAAVAARPVDPRQRTLPNIPTLTDVVSGPVRDTVRPTPPPKPRKPTPQAEQIRRLEDYVYARIKEKLDGDVEALVEKRLMPAAADAIAQILGEAADLLKAGLRDLVREAVEEALARSQRGELDGSPPDTAAGPERDNP